MSVLGSLCNVRVDLALDGVLSVGTLLVSLYILVLFGNETHGDLECLNG